MPARKIKNFISSKISKIKGTFSFDINLLLQIAAMHTYNSNALQTLKSNIENSILKLNSNDYQPIKCRLYADIKVQNLILNKYIDVNFHPINQDKINAILLLRNESLASTILVDLISSEYFDQIVNSVEIEDISAKIYIILCHFCRCKYILPSHQSTIIANKLEIILPKIPKLNDYLELEKEKFECFQKKFTSKDIEIEINKRGFPSFYPISMPKSAYIYDYIISGKLEKTVEYHCVSINKIWYALKEIRYILDAIKPLLKKKPPTILKAFENCNATINKRFFDINN